jgi:hypothetical protein
MPNDLRVRAGPLVSTMPRNGTTITDQQMENRIMAYCRAMGIGTEGLSKQQILDLFTEAMFHEADKIARTQLRREKQATQATALANEINTELGT